MRRLFLIMLALLALTPLGAMAEELRPATGTAWDLYVNGNSYVVQEVLTGVKLLMSGSGSGFKTILVFMATVGFLLLAIGAGFDPGKNLLRMFTYVIFAWGVSYGSTQLTADVVINDMVDTSNAPFVDDVPALVALPAVVTSQIGVTFTRFIETFFTGVSDTAFTVSAGQFNLFNRMLEESSQFSFQSPELKKSLSAYTTNCVVPTMALGSLSVQELTTSTNMVASLEKANHNSLLTQYYAPSERTSLPNAPELSGSGATLEMSRGPGLMMSCNSAFTAIKEDMEQGAQAMLEAGAAAWSKSGIMTPFETAYSSLLAKASAPGGGSSGGFGSPSGFILQQAMLNVSAGTYRHAAMQTGNNEMVQAASLAQAEQQQKSAWVAGFSVFNNMMGYVFTILQTLIFAMTPLIIIALLVPGLGPKIFANYAQVLIWMTLWQPMLAIVNFILQLYGSHGFAESIGMAGGLNNGNKYIISERSKDLVIAGQFLGTMVPLLTWGIVKGAMAFTEFISSGVGSQFATQAGAAAATGNLSMNNLSMNNTSLDKYSTQMSSAVGFQDVKMGTSAGAMTVTQTQGGTVTTRNEEKLNEAKSMELSAKNEAARNKSVSEAASTTVAQETSFAGVASLAANRSQSASVREAAMRTLANELSVKEGMSQSDALREVKAAVAADDAAAQSSGQRGVDASLSYNQKVGGAVGSLVERVGGASLNVAVKGSASNSATQTATARTGTSEENAQSRDAGTSKAVSQGESQNNSRSSSREMGSSVDASEGTRYDESAAVKRAANQVKTETEQASQSWSAVASAASRLSVSEEMDMQRYEAVRSQYQALTAGLPSKEALERKQAEFSANLNVAGDSGAIAGDANAGVLGAKDSQSQIRRETTKGPGSFGNAADGPLAGKAKEVRQEIAGRQDTLQDNQAVKTQVANASWNDAHNNKGLDARNAKQEKEAQQEVRAGTRPVGAAVSLGDQARAAAGAKPAGPAPATPKSKGVEGSW